MKTLLLLTLVTLICSCESRVPVRILETGQKIKIHVDQDLYNIGDTIIVSRTSRNWYIKEQFINFKGLSDWNSTFFKYANGDSTQHIWVNYKAILIE